jgi:BMFP domain-containing protein YqiC
MIKPDFSAHFANLQGVLSQAKTTVDNVLASPTTQEAKFKAEAMMQQTLAKIGAVPRDEFEHQYEQLLKLTERVERLEQQLAAITAHQPGAAQVMPTNPDPTDLTN